mmetsp:Transcript_43368/g.139365  ORF Transcript_43368/g.139365 Transcript_43368/m.139365 type:complete len:298 (+) Transcript_43368:758-1651(+)
MHGPRHGGQEPLEIRGAQHRGRHDEQRHRGVHALFQGEERWRSRRSDLHEPLPSRDQHARQPVAAVRRVGAWGQRREKAAQQQVEEDVREPVRQDRVVVAGHWLILLTVQEEPREHEQPHPSSPQLLGRGLESHRQPSPADATRPRVRPHHAVQGGRQPRQRAAQEQPGGVVEVTRLGLVEAERCCWRQQRPLPSMRSAEWADIRVEGHGAALIHVPLQLRRGQAGGRRAFPEEQERRHKKRRWPSGKHAPERDPERLLHANGIVEACGGHESWLGQEHQVSHGCIQRKLPQHIRRI